MSEEQVRTDGPATGPGDPADPGATVALPQDPPTTTPPPHTSPKRPAPAPHSRISGVWVGLIFSALVLLFLLIFILQNMGAVQIYFLGGSGTLPTGVALLLAAIAGVLLVAIPGTARIVQLRRQARKGRKRAV
ncbi:hypothetical protein GCM10009836_04590 [Pseudonocardia ailaonensis]|uniref:Lipopolysaccharide assembly protein A domain-containing protein n=1 Tax=Pseudonocardia ailaonensis TaxID=367279 RepID=A0ABN2MK13_9PSEU